MATDAKKPSNLSKSSKPLESSSPSSSSLKKKAIEGSPKMAKKTTIQSKVVAKTRQKKVYTLPGQKYDVPEEREPLRIFYESLSKQIPSSEMAEFWLMEHGMLSPERARKAYERKQRKQKEIRTGTPMKSNNRATTSKHPRGSDDEDHVPISIRRKK